MNQHEEQIELICKSHIGSVNSFVDDEGKNHFKPMVRELSDLVNKILVDELYWVFEEAERLQRQKALRYPELIKGVHQAGNGLEKLYFDRVAVLEGKATND